MATNAPDEIEWLARAVAGIKNVNGFAAVLYKNDADAIVTFIIADRIRELRVVVIGSLRNAARVEREMKHAEAADALEGMAEAFEDDVVRLHRLLDERKT